MLPGLRVEIHVKKLSTSPAKNRQVKMMAMVSGIAAAQKSHWFDRKLRMSAVFMPRKLVMNDRGRKMMVTKVKA